MLHSKIAYAIIAFAMILSDAFLNYLTIGLIIFLALFFALWVSLIVWAYRDMRSRSRDLFAQLLSAIVVAILPVVGILIYLILRPTDTLSESFERALAEEALLQEIEKKPYCPGCSRNVHASWQVCPYCHLRLKKPCHACHELVELQWTICPFCANHQHSETGQPQVNAQDDDAGNQESFNYEDDESGIWTVSN
ncbi:MAG: RNA polymerase subunit RPABC4/transcription elongation factor Spt4/heme/copper-type cytochrome [Cellvibrionaceae bacterium]